VPASKSAFPPALRNKVPPMILMFLDQRFFFTLFGMVFCIFTLYGPLVGRPDHNGYRYLLAPLVCPLLPALYFIFWPFDPFRGSAARLAGMVDYDKSDQGAKRLSEVLASREARQFIWRTTTVISGALFAVMVILAVIVRSSLNWLFPSAWLGQGLIGCCIGCFIALGTEYVRWGLTTWANQSPVS